LRILIKPLFILSFLLASSVVIAATGGESKKNGEPNAKKESTQGQDGKGRRVSESTGGGSEGRYSEDEQQEVDSTNNDSVSKYNFIFYFLYKFNYDQGQALEKF